MEKNSYTNKNISEKLQKKDVKTWVTRFFTTLAVVLATYSPIIERVQIFAQSKPNAETSITPDLFNGREPTLEERAFSVMIRTSGGSCSGSIKDEHTIITADHCIKDVNPSFITVTLDGDPTNTARKVSKVFNIAQDIYYGNDENALILEEPIIFSETITPIPLGHTSMISQFPLFIEGHGGSEEGAFTTNPKVGKLTHHPLYACNLQNMIFTKNVDPSTDQPIGYFGDSGGPLFTYLDTSFYVEEEKKLYEPGYYLLGVYTRFCSEITIGENGEPDPGIIMGFHSLVDPKVKAVFKEIEESAPSFFIEQHYLPHIQKNPVRQVFMPIIDNTK